MKLRNRLAGRGETWGPQDSQHLSILARRHWTIRYWTHQQHAAGCSHSSSAVKLQWARGGNTGGPRDSRRLGDPGALEALGGAPQALPGVGAGARVVHVALHHPLEVPRQLLQDRMAATDWMRKTPAISTNEETIYVAMSPPLTAEAQNVTAIRTNAVASFPVMAPMGSCCSPRMYVQGWHTKPDCQRACTGDKLLWQEWHVSLRS